jgi:hypothetical protein
MYAIQFAEIKAAAKANFQKTPGESIKAKVDLSWCPIANAITQKTSDQTARCETISKGVAG